jgi:hypothetical protein
LFLPITHYSSRITHNASLAVAFTDHSSLITGSCSTFSYIEQTDEIDETDQRDQIDQMD